MYHRRNQFLGHELKNKLIKNKYRIKAKFATLENPQSNSILELINKCIANLVHTFGFKNY